jgi:hypothetical protein
MHEEPIVRCAICDYRQPMIDSSICGKCEYEIGRKYQIETARDLLSASKEAEEVISRVLKCPEIADFPGDEYYWLSNVRNQLFNAISKVEGIE